MFCFKCNVFKSKIIENCLTWHKTRLSWDTFAFELPHHESLQPCESTKDWIPHFHTKSIYKCNSLEARFTFSKKVLTILWSDILNGGLTFFVEYEPKGVKAFIRFSYCSNFVFFRLLPVCTVTFEYFNLKDKQFLILPNSLIRYLSPLKTKRIFQMLWSVFGNSFCFGCREISRKTGSAYSFKLNYSKITVVVAFGHAVSGTFFLSVVAWSSFLLPLFIHNGQHLKPKLCTK